jgi:lipopolysaccharide transport system ATP-binding protein
MDSRSICVNGIGKKYYIGKQREKYLTIRESIVNSVKKSLKFYNASHPTNELWALDNISFDVNSGESVGIIGGNGAGKSTLLKILSRITLPTVGEARLHGRVGSMLEVGTGFHPELTGRENIILSGSIIGLKKREIDDKFEEIVKFAEIERFIDTPVKRYSSGMYVRLAFSVAAYLDAEILLVDEVLAVGDVKFQRKCIGRMGSISKDDRTILFVSHNMSAIKNLCPRSIYLRNGKKIRDGDTFDVVDEYIQYFNKNSNNTRLEERNDRNGSGELLITDIQFYDKNRVPTNSINSGDSCYIEIKYRSVFGNLNPNMVFGLTIYSRGCPLVTFSSDFVNFSLEKFEKNGSVFCFVESLPLSPGVYSYNIICTLLTGTVDHIIDAGKLTINESDIFKEEILPFSSQVGTVMLKQKWYSNPNS